MTAISPIDAMPTSSGASRAAAVARVTPPQPIQPAHRWPSAPRRVAFGAILFASILYPWAWSNLLPFGRGPDEPDHFDMVNFLVTERRLPVFGRDADRWVHLSELGQPVESYAPYPQLTYALIAPLVAMAPLEPFHAARLISVISAPIIVACAYAVARRLAPTRSSIALGAALLVVLIPQVAFVGGYLNRDAFASAAAAMVVWLSVEAALAEWRVRRAFTVGLALGVVALTNYPAYVVGVVPALLIIGAAWRTPSRLVALGAASALGALIVSGWWFARNLWLYQEVLPDQIIRDAQVAAAPGFRVATADRGLDAWRLLTQTKWLLDTFSSFWGVFDHQNLFLAPWHYGVLVALTAVAVVGCGALVAKWVVRRIITLGRPGGVAAIEPTANRRALVCGALGLYVFALLGAALWFSVSRDNSPQGRYLFPALVPLAIFFVAGWREAGSALVRGVAWGGDHRLASGGRVIAWLGLWSWLIWLNVVAVRDYVVPRYYTGVVDRVRVTLNEPEWGVVAPASQRLHVEGWAIVERGLVWQPAYLWRAPQWYTPARAIGVFGNAAPTTGGVEFGLAEPVERPDVASRFGGDRRLLATGFALAIDPRALPAGRNRLFVCAWGDQFAATGELVTENRYCATTPIVVDLVR